ncbi:MAG: hypothetical protein AB7S50_02120 [Bacteroidales bacterium]
MKTRKLITEILLTFAITLVTSGIVTLLWNIIIEKVGTEIDWKTSFIMAIIIGIVIPLSRTKEN